MARLPVNDAEGAEVVALVALQGYTRIETHEGIAGYQGVGAKTGILSCIGHDKRFISGDGVGTEGHLPRGLACIQAVVGEKPLPLPIHQGDQGNRSFQHGGRQPHQTVEVFIPRVVEDSLPLEVALALKLVLGDGEIGVRHVHRPRFTNLGRP